MRRTPLLLLLAVALTACSGPGGASGVGGSPNLLTLAEIQAFAETGAGQTAYDLVTQRRRTWLTTRGPGNDEGEGLSVFEGSNYLGGIDALERLDLAQVGQLEYLDPRTATTRYSPSNYSLDRGAIVVTFR